MNTVLRDIRRLETLPWVRDPVRSASTRPSPVTGMVRRLEQLVCRMTGHDDLLRFQPDRLSLHCSLCGYQSAGWEVGSPRVDLGLARGSISSSARREEDVIALGRLSSLDGLQPSP
jgi:hypothetical protein